MEQYNQPGDMEEAPLVPVKVSTEAKQIQSLESTIKQLFDTVGSQQHEISKLHREISRLKSDVSDIVTTLRNRG